MVVSVQASQTSKTDGIVLNVIGHRIDDDPVPILYIGPTESFVTKVISPRLKQLFSSSDSLLNKLGSEKDNSKTQTNIAGVKVRLAWAGSATEIAGDPAGISIVDERDRMDKDVKGEGDVTEMAKARHSTYPDGKTIVISSPTLGTVETRIDPRTGLEHWQPSDEIDSPTWKLMQEGTRFEWAWPCPDCNEYFIPRFKLLTWPKKCTPAQAKTEARLACPCCGSLIAEESKSLMNQRGVYVAPDQKIFPFEEGDDCVYVENINDQNLALDKNSKNVNQVEFGTYLLPETYNNVASFWSSGLVSTWRSFGNRASNFLAAVRSGDPERVQTVLNTGFGELYVIKGDAPEWTVVANLRMPYKFCEINPAIQFITCSVDVQKNSLIWGVRGWGYGSESWLIEHGEIQGDTKALETWYELDKFRDRWYGDLPIFRMFVDSGYRPEMVYPFCRKHLAWAFPTKGHDTQDKPIKINKIDITYEGKLLKDGLQLFHIDSNYFKSWVHTRVEWDPTKPGGWHLSEETTEDYCKQIVAETKVVLPSGKVKWMRIKRDNHYLDVEALNFAAAHSLNVHLLERKPIENPDVKGPAPKKKSVRPRRVESNFMKRGRR